MVIKQYDMKRYFNILALFLFTAFAWMSCSKEDFPVDEDGLLITTRAECYVSDFQLLGSDFQTVLTAKKPVIDTTACTIDAEVQYGTDLKNVYPQFSLVTDAKLDPKITGKVDFSDLANPRKYTVVSGNRQVRKTYTVYITIQQ
jgi:hypothetical protein